MSPIREFLLNTIEQASEVELADILSLIQSHPLNVPAIDPSTQAWNVVLDRLNHLTPEQRIQQRQSIYDLFQTWDETGEEIEDDWEELKSALDRNRTSYRPLFT